ncbi:MAG: aspartate aminotransferase family protein, partial [Terracidiphilus sp.]
ALELDRRLRADGRFEALTAGGPELDIVVWKMMAATAALASRLGQSIFSACAGRNLHLALVQLPQFWFGPAGDSDMPEEHVVCLRSVMMKPEHEAWLDRIWNLLSVACAEVEKG